MRQMPLPFQAPLNPNDQTMAANSYGMKKKQFTNVNQHYISHNAVIPPYDLKLAMADLDQQTRDPLGHPVYNDPQRGTPYIDPNDRVSIKPQTLSRDQTEQLRQQINAAKPAGVVNLELVHGAGANRSSTLEHEARVDRRHLANAGLRSLRPADMMNYKQPNSQSGHYSSVPGANLGSPQGKVKLNGHLYDIEGGASGAPPMPQSLLMSSADPARMPTPQQVAASQEIANHEADMQRFARGEDDRQQQFYQNYQSNGASAEQLVVDPSSRRQESRGNGAAMEYPVVRQASPINQSLHPASSAQQRPQQQQTIVPSSSNGVLSGIGGPMPHGQRGGAFGKPQVKPPSQNGPQYGHVGAIVSQIDRPNPGSPYANQVRTKPSLNAASNAASTKELEYDPFYANAQNFVAKQKAQLDRQNQIYSKHMNDVMLPDQVKKEQESKEEREREERRKLHASHMIEAQRVQKLDLKNSYKGVLHSQIQEHQASKHAQLHERMAMQQVSAQKSDLIRQQEAQMREMKAMQQAEYRSILDGQKATNQANQNIYAGRVAPIGGTRLASGDQNRPRVQSNYAQAYISSNQGVSSSQAPPAGMRRFPQ